MKSIDVEPNLDHELFAQATTNRKKKSTVLQGPASRVGRRLRRCQARSGRVAASLTAAAVVLCWAFPGQAQSDAEQPSVSVVVATAVVDSNGDPAAEVAESVGTVRVVVSAATNNEQKPPDDVSFGLGATEGTAIRTEDFEYFSESATISPSDWVLVEGGGSYTAELEYALSIVDDLWDEYDRETLHVTTTSADTPAYVTLPGWVDLVIIDDDSAPGSPTNLEAVAAGPTAIDLNWTAPSDPGTSPVDGYRIEWSADGNTNWTSLVEQTESPATTYGDGGLSAETTRYYRVTAISAAGFSRPSDSAGTTTARALPSVSVVVTTAVVDSNGDPAAEVAESVGTARVVVSAATNNEQKPPDDVSFGLGATEGTAIRTEDFEYFSESATISPSDWVLVEGGGSYTAELEYALSIVDDLWDEYDRETLHVTTTSSDTPAYVTLPGWVDLVIVDDDLAPGSPTNLEAVAAGPTAIDLNWTAPGDPGTSPVDGYRIEWSADGNTNWTSLVEKTESAATTYGDGGLSAETTRYYRVTAISAAGFSRPSDSAGTTTARALPSVSVVVTTAVVDSNGDPVAELDESVGTARVVVSAATNNEQKPPDDVSFRLGATEGTAIRTEDFEYFSESATISPSDWVLVEGGGSYTAELEYALSIVDDLWDEYDRETLHVTTTSSDTPAYVTLPGWVDLVIVDDDLAPGSPTNLEAVAAGLTAIDLNWTAPGDPGTSPVDGYRIEWSADGNTNWTSLVEQTESPATTYGDGGLSAETTRYYRVTAISAAGFSRPSDSARGTTGHPLPVITVDPGSTPIVEGGEARFNVRRAGPVEQELEITLEVATTDSMASSGSETVTVTMEAESSLRLFGLVTHSDDQKEPDATVTVTVVAPDDASYLVGSPLSAVVVVQDEDSASGPPTESDATVPGPPTDLEATAAGTKAIALSWSPPAGSTNPPITGYLIEWSPDGSSDWTVLVEDTESAETTHTNDGLEPGATRHYRASAINLEGVGEPSESAGATTATDSSALPEVTIATGSTPVTEGMDVTFVVSRTGSMEDELSVSVNVAETGSVISDIPPASVVVDAGENRTTLTIRTVDDEYDEEDSDVSATLTAASEARYRVGAASSATARVKDNDASSVVGGIPGAPTDLVAAADGQATGLNWGAPENEGSPPLFGYEIQWSPDGRRSWSRLGETGAGVTTYRDVGLAPGTTRYYRVRAKNTVGQGPFSNTVSAVTSLALPNVTIRAENGPIVEGAQAMFSLRRTGPTAEPLTVRLDVAAAGVLTDGPLPASAVFAVGADAIAVAVPTVDDSMDGPDQEITATLLEGEGYARTGSSSATVTIRDNDAPPILEVVGSSVLESEGQMTFVVLLASPTGLPVRVQWSTGADTASPGVDYAVAAGLLTIDPGATSARIVVPVHDDSVFEDDETFTVVLSQPENADLSDSASSATGVIENDDATPVLRVEDASAAESAGELVFVVTLKGQTALPVAVHWATSAGTAQAGLDYFDATGTVTMEPGTTHATVAVELIEDLLHEQAETLHLSLSEATNTILEGGGEAVALGTIEDDDDMVPAEAWLARFGRTAASNAIGALEDRVTGRFGLGQHLTLAGHRIEVSGGRSKDAAAPSVAGLGGTHPAVGGAVGMAGFNVRTPGGDVRLDGSGRVDMADLLARSSFLFSPDSGSHEDRLQAGKSGADGGEVRSQRWSLWGSGSATRFAGSEGALGIRGDVVTGTVGADIERGRVLFGVAVSHSRGNGEYGVPGVNGHRPREGDVSGDLTTGLPYLRVTVNDRLSAWGALGRGSGSMTLRGDDVASVRTDTDMSMGVLGARQELRSPAASNGLRLALRADLLLARTTSDETVGLPSLSTDVARMRLLVEGARQWRLESGSLLAPSAELGLRYDDGDAEAGTGVEVGAGLSYENAARGLAAEMNVRSLLAHEAGGFSEWGVGGSVRYAPTGGERGVTLGLGASWGAASSGVERLWEQQRTVNAPGSSSAAPSAVAEADFGYGVPVLDGRGWVTPYVGARVSERSGSAYRAGARLRVGEFIDLDIEGARVERSGLPLPDLQAVLMASLRW